MEPKNFNIAGVIYSNVGVINFLGHTYIILQNNIDLKYIEMKNINGNITYFFPTINFNDYESLKGILFCNELVSDIKNDIQNQKITTKEQIENKIFKIMEIINNDKEFNKLITSDITSYQNNIKNIYNYLISYNPKEEINNEIDLTVDEIERLLQTRGNELTEEQKLMFEQLLNKKNETITSSGVTASKRLAKNIYGNKVVEDEPLIENKAAYVSVISLCLFVQIFILLGIVALIYYMR